MMRGTATRNAFCIVALVLGASAQTAKGPVFEVATIKPAQQPNPADIMAGKLHIGMNIEAGRVDIGFLSLENLLGLAYDVKTYQIVGPDWIKTTRFDIVAKMPEGSNKDQVPEMLKALLSERFKVTVHKESREHAMYALIVGKGGPKLKEAPPDPEPAAASSSESAGKGGQSFTVNGSQMRVNPNSDGKGVTLNSAQTGNMKMSMGPDGMMHMEASKVNMTTFVNMLNRFVDKPVVDKTDLKGNYQIALDLSMATLMRVASASGIVAIPPGAAIPGASGGGGGVADAASDPGGGGSVFTAVQSLGLKLDPRKESVDTYVVDHIEKTPTDN